MARMKRRNAEGKLKKINRPSPKRKETRRLQDLEKRQAFNNKKAEEQQFKDMMARQAAYILPKYPPKIAGHHLHSNKFQKKTEQLQYCE